MTVYNNPWLTIPAQDYESHMADPGVGQSRFLARQFKKALGSFDPGTVALIGCATGNGLEHIENRRTQELAAIDINADYLKILEARYSGKINGLRLIHADVETATLKKGAWTLVFAGLIFEYVMPETLLENIYQWLSPGGVMTAVLQQPGVKNETVSASPYKSLLQLKSVINLIVPDAFDRKAQSAGLTKISGERVVLASQKSFYVTAWEKKDSPVNS